MNFIYSIIMSGLAAFMRVAALWVPKAKLWVTGRQNWRKRYADALSTFAPDRKRLWIHAASLGEFEQGRPIIEAVRQAHPDWVVVLTFFSPSGFEIRKNYPHADFIAYLPVDTRQNAQDFWAIVQPDVAIFIKYEFWANYLHTLKANGIPTLLVSAIFRETQPFFKWYGAFWRSMLGCFTHLFVQDAASKTLLGQAGFANVTVAGDTRIDRVLANAESAPANDLVAAFAEGSKVFIVGSAWGADEDVFLPVLLKNPTIKSVFSKIIIAPHEPNEKHISGLLAKINGLGSAAVTAVRYTQATESQVRRAQILVIDNIGMLNTLYRYGTVAYIGGGFGKGIHNTLEPAAWGLPIIFGPKFQKFEEARQLTACGAAFAVENTADFEKIMEKLAHSEFQATAGSTSKAWLGENKGATARILSFLWQFHALKP